ILFFDLQAILGDKVIAAAIFVTIEQEDALVQRNQHARYPESSPSGDYKKIEVAVFVHVSFGKTSRSQDGADEGKAAEKASASMGQIRHAHGLVVTPQPPLCGTFIGMQSIKVAITIHASQLRKSFQRAVDIASRDAVCTEEFENFF